MVSPIILDIDGKPVVVGSYMIRAQCYSGNNPKLRFSKVLNVFSIDFQNMLDGKDA